MANIIVLDTETANGLEDPIIYDLGFAVIDDETWNVVETFSYAIQETFMDKDLMASAYYAEKIPQYWGEIWAKQRRLVTREFARSSLRCTCQKYHVEKIFAHNARFDNRACKVTERYQTQSRQRYFFPCGVKVYDTLRMARRAFGKDEEYINFCNENGFITARGQVRLTAEILYKYLSGCLEFEEEHKGINDVLIEAQILAACRARGIEDLSPYKSEDGN